MIRILQPRLCSGSVRAPSSKSMTHRLLLCAALAGQETVLISPASCRDTDATIACLRALGARISARDDGSLHIVPIASPPKATVDLPCAESGTTLRFLLPLVGALGASAVFHMSGRLPQRPLQELCDSLCAHGMTIRRDGDTLRCSGSLTPGRYTLPGNISSQYISALLLSLPLLERESTLTITTPPESRGYIDMTEDALALCRIRFERSGLTYRIPPHQRPMPDEQVRIEGDYSAASAFLCAGALSRGGVTVENLRPDSLQGDRAILDYLRRFGAEVLLDGSRVSVRGGALRGVNIDLSQTPDLISTVCVVAACAEGKTQITGASRTRAKESDRIRSTAAMLRALGGDVSELPDGLVIRGAQTLRGGVVDPFHDHRIAMAAAVASCACRSDVTISDCECVEKSYPAFWDDFSLCRSVRTGAHL